VWTGRKANEFSRKAAQNKLERVSHEETTTDNERAGSNQYVGGLGKRVCSDSAGITQPIQVTVGGYMNQFFSYVSQDNRTFGSATHASHVDW